MGKRRKGSNKMGSSIPLENAADSDNDLDLGKSHFDAMDRYVKQLIFLHAAQDKEIISKLCSSGPRTKRRVTSGES